MPFSRISHCSEVQREHAGEWRKKSNRRSTEEKTESEGRWYGRHGQECWFYGVWDLASILTGLLFARELPLLAPLEKAIPSIGANAPVRPSPEKRNQLPWDLDSRPR